MIKYEAVQEMPGVWCIKAEGRVLASLTVIDGGALDMGKLAKNVAATMVGQPMPYQIDAPVRAMQYERHKGGEIVVRACRGESGNSVACARLRSVRHLSHKRVGRLLGRITPTVQGRGVERKQTPAPKARTQGL